MGWPIVVVSSGGLPVTESTIGFGTPVDVASNGFGVPVTVVASGGLPVVGAQLGPYPAPSGYRWDYVTENGVTVTESGSPVVELVRAN